MATLRIFFGKVGASSGAATISPTGIPSEEAIGSPQLSLEVAGAGGIVSAEALGTPGAAAVLEPQGIVSEEAFGTPTVGAIPASITDAGGIASEEAVGTPTVALGAVVIAGVSGGKRKRFPYRDQYWQEVIRGRGISEQLPQEGEGVGKLIPLRASVRGRGASGQVKQESVGAGRLDFEKRNQRELEELLLLEVA